MFGKNKKETKPEPKKDEEKKKKKKDRGIFSFLNSKTLKKPNRVGVLYLRNNGVAEPMEVESHRGFFIIEGKTYHDNRDCIFTVITKDKDRVPLAVIPEWSLIPLGTKRWEDRSMLEKFAELQDHTIKGIRNSELVKMGDQPYKKPMTPKQMILWGLAVLVGGIVLVNFI